MVGVLSSLRLPVRQTIESQAAVQPTAATIQSTNHDSVLKISLDKSAFLKEEDPKGATSEEVDK